VEDPVAEHPDEAVTSDAEGTPTVLVVGGSLVGLSSAIALARSGAAVTVLERTGSSGYEGGGGLGVDVELLAAVTGLSATPPVCRGPDRATTAWPLLAAWLETQARSVPGVEVVRGAEVVEVGDGWVRTRAGRHHEAELIVGADGSRSTVRRWVSPASPEATYAGYLLWRAMVAEDDLPAGVARLASDEPSREHYSGPYRLVTYPVPGADGSCARGHRRLNLVWYDPAHTELLTGVGLLEGESVYGSLAAADVPAPLREELRALSQRRWPAPWGEALDEALRRSLVFATPVVHYRPDRLVRGRVVIVGDAAHAASPMVGGGFRQGLFDAAALAAAFDRAGGLPAADVLERYQEQRLRPAQAHVEHSVAASASYMLRSR
jgi:2-polyprenyl-6-methoxyphenol hydroxylase-like FAD-dependent oxidoreductase